MNKRLIYSLIICLLITLSFSCSKDNSSSIITNYLTSAPWKPSIIDRDISTNPAGGLTYAYTAPSCTDDDVYTFGASQVTINKGTKLCTPGETNPQVLNYTLDLVNNKIIIGSSAYDLYELDNMQLKYGNATSTGYTVYVYSR